MALNNTENLSFTLNGIYSVLSNANQDSYSNIYLSLPHYDFITKGKFLKQKFLVKSNFFLYLQILMFP